jgi:hypothetical protein
MKIDIETHKDTFKGEIAKLIEDYGNPSEVPSDQQFLVSERLRAAYCINANPELPVAQIFKTYSVDQRVWHHFVDDAADMKIERRMTRAEKVAGVVKWTEDHVGEQVTLEKLMEIGDIAYSMAKKIVDDRPDIFWKVKRGIFEVRDPKADREADKAKAAAADADADAKQS